MLPHITMNFLYTTCNIESTNLLQMLQSFPQCQWVPLVTLWWTGQWLWPVAVMLTQQLITPGTRWMWLQTFNLSVKKHSLSSAPSSPLTLESITVQLRTSWGRGHLSTSSSMWNVSESALQSYEPGWDFTDHAAHSVCCYSSLSSSRF